MYILSMSVYDSTMPITLTQLEDKVVAAAEENRPGDTKGIARAVSFVMGTLTQPYALQPRSHAFFDRNCVLDYIEADDDIDLATFYDLCYLSRFIGAAENAINSKRASVIAVEDATRALINGSALKVAMNMVASQTYEYANERDFATRTTMWSRRQLEDGSYDPTKAYLPVASYWAPMSNYRFGEAFSAHNATHFEYASDDNKRWLAQQPSFDARVLRALPKSDLVKELQALGRESLLADMVSTDEAVLQTQKQLVLNTRSAAVIANVIGHNPAFLHRFLFDEELHETLTKLSRSRKSALGLYFAVGRAIANDAFWFVSSQRLNGPSDLAMYLLTPEMAHSGKIKKKVLEDYDVIRIVSALYFATALDKPARKLFGAVVLPRISGLNDLPDVVSQRAFDARYDENLDDFNVGVSGASAELAEIITDAEDVLRGFSLDRIREEYEELTRGVLEYKIPPVNRDKRAGRNIKDMSSKYFSLRPGAARQLVERRLQELD